MLETIREFAEDRLVEAGEANDVRQLHVECMLALVGPIADDFERGIDPLGAMWPEFANIRRALALVERADQNRLGLRLVGASWPLWYVSGAAREGGRWARRFLERTRGDQTLDRARALMAASVFAGWTGDLVEAEAYAAECLPMLRTLGDVRNVVPLLSNLGLVAYQCGDPTASSGRMEEAAEAARTCGNAFQVAVALGNLCELSLVDRAPERAAALADESWAIFDALGSEWGRAWMQLTRAYCLYALGDDEQSLSSAINALTRLEDTIDVAHLPHAAILVAALVSRSRGDDEVAARLVGAADAAMVSSEREAAVGTDVELRRQALDVAGRALGPRRFGAALAAGRAVPASDLRRYALEVAERLQRDSAVA